VMQKVSVVFEFTALNFDGKRIQLTRRVCFQTDH